MGADNPLAWARSNRADVARYARRIGEIAARSRDVLASWGSSYCKGARSNRERLVRELLAAGLRVEIYGEEGNCLRTVRTPRSGDQYRDMRAHRFYLAFENHRLDGYVTEKVRGGDMKYARRCRRAA